MRSKTRRFLDIGTGPRARKAVDLAIKHPRTQVVAMDIRRDVLYAKYLKSLGLTSKPVNLDVRGGIHALEYLQKQKPNSFDYMSAHFVLQHQGIKGRKAIVKEVMRVLKPGGKLYALSEHSFFGQEAFEARSLGFKVEVKPLSAKRVGELGTDHAYENAHGGRGKAGSIHLEEVIKAQAKLRGLPVEVIQKEYFDAVRSQSEEYASKREPLPWNQEQKDSIKRIMHDEKLRFTDKRFVVLIITKPRTRYVGPSGAKTTSYSIERTRKEEKK